MDRQQNKDGTSANQVGATSQFLTINKTN
ncbi:hypothetical protein CMALT394_170046 [Carnobacterium maltaromaticum]|nr:hypothetical protein CMALT394_170046 [Carnobacterium maltaromaticum]